MIICNCTTYIFVKLSIYIDYIYLNTIAKTLNYLHGEKKGNFLKADSTCY